MKLYKDKLFLIFGLVAGLFSFIIYYLTKAPTVSFWDCGEFIACSKILGIPHPPGTPLFILIGRFFILLPLPFTDAVKINFISVLSSAATVFVAYWLIVRLVVGFEERSLPLAKKLAATVGGFAGSMIMAFSSTYWDNAIEAEVYGAAMLLMLIVCYLTLLWSSKIGKPGSGKFMVAIVYLAFLSIGIHLTAFLVMPVLFLYMVIKDKSLLIDYRFLIIWLILLMVTVSFNTFFWGLLAAIIVLAIVIFSRPHALYPWLLALAIALAALVGYSSHVYIPLRAIQKPAINENNPDNWPRFKAFLERKQYGQESMFTRILTRRGTWSNQFGTYPHMGFWGFFREQYSKPWLAFLFFALGIWGLYEAVRRHQLDGIMVLLLLILSTIGLLLYLNFSDGTRGAMLEVRNRDYFYTPGFMFFAIFIGIGISNLLGDISDWIGKQSWRKIIYGFAIAVALLMPIHSLQANYFNHNRSRNWIPWDYAYNILMSTDKDGVLFTNGDNDTFPLWYLQEVEKYRTDIKIVNLSLLNTPWYIHQLKNQMGVPITYSDDQIDMLQPRWLADQQKLWRVQDEMIRHIIKANNWKIPIFFALTVANENRLGLDDYLIQEGMANRLTSTKGKSRVDIDISYRRYMEEFKYRGLGDSTIYKDENDIRLVANYVSGFLQLADTLKNAGQIDKAVSVTTRAIQIFPDEWRSRAYLAGLYAVTGKIENITSLVKGLDSLDAAKAYINAGQELLLKMNYPKAKELLEIALKYDPRSQAALKNLLYSANQYGDTIYIDSLTLRYRAAFKDDPAAINGLDNFLKSIRAQKPN
jgi:tetratricopeptide (TPR) repeat protein